VALTAFGVPEITPLAALRLSPGGSAGLTVKEVSVPVVVGVIGVIAVPVANV